MSAEQVGLSVSDAATLEAMVRQARSDAQDCERCGSDRTVPMGSGIVVCADCFLPRLVRSKP